MKTINFTLTLLSLLFFVNTNGQRSSDIEGGKDHALISRFDNSVIEWYQIKNFDRYYMLSLKGNQLDKYQIDGKITRIQYSTLPEHSVFEIYKSYENTLKDAEFDILLTLDKTNCGINLTEQLYIGEFNGLNALPAGKSIKPDYKEGLFAYLSAKKKFDDKEVYIVVYVTERHFPLITLDVVEVQTLKKDGISVKDISRGINENGKIAIYNIYFDSGKYEIKPESKKALQNIADYLNLNKDSQYIIVGHTDNEGNFEQNIKLSQKRAESIKNILVEDYNVEEEQLLIFGVGSVAPLANNNTKEGKAKNRRVEIVKL